LILTANKPSTPIPYINQCFRIERTRTKLNGDPLSHEVVYGITSLFPRMANAKKLLMYNRGHWSIENKSHHVRDVSFGEDSSRVRTQSGPQVMATLRNVTIGLLRLAGAGGGMIPTAIRKSMWGDRRLPMRMIGIVG
jgi:predicted transposase YbfD/YdcC